MIAWRGHGSFRNRFQTYYTRIDESILGSIPGLGLLESALEHLLMDNSFLLHALQGSS